MYTSRNASASVTIWSSSAGPTVRLLIAGETDPTPETVTRMRVSQLEVPRSTKGGHPLHLLPMATSQTPTGTTTSPTDITQETITTPVVPTELRTLTSLTMVRTPLTSNGRISWMERCMGTVTGGKPNAIACFTCLEGLKEKPGITCMPGGERILTTHFSTWPKLFQHL